MLWKKLIFIILLLYIYTTIIFAETYTVSPTGSHSDQDVINEALEKAASSGGGIVYLKADGQNNVFVIDNPIKIVSSNIVLTGDPNVIVKVYSGSDAKQWYTGTTSIITSLYNDNIEIYGFQIDGSCDKLPFEYHHSRADTAHDCERAIYVAGQTGKFCDNIKIHDMQIDNCFSDGVHVRFATNVHCYSNFINNCQHEGIFWTSIITGLMEKNNIAGITSDCARIDNGVKIIVQNNYFFSYTGDKNNQAPKGWANGIQIADAGASKGYNGSKKPTHTTDIEVRWNTFVNTGEKAVWLDSTWKGYDNVYIHDNKFVNVKEFTNPGESVELNFEVSNVSLPVNLTDTVQPTKEMSERIFSDIFDIMYADFVEQIDENSTVVLPKGVNETPSNVTATITRYHGIQTLVYVPSDGLTSIEVQADENTSTHTLMLGEKQGSTVVYSNVSIWDGLHSGDTFFFEGNPENIKIICKTPKGSFTPAIITEKIEQNTKLFNSWIFIYLFVVSVFLGVVFIVLTIVFKWPKY